jgi:hypothetical protein
MLRVFEYLKYFTLFHIYTFAHFKWNFKLFQKK